MRFNWLMVSFIAAVCLLQSCAKDVDYITTISPSDNPYLIQIDTFSAEGIVYRPDSFVTASKTLLYAGKHNDPVFGQLNCISYMRPTLPASTPDQPGNTSYYDSIVLIIKPKKIYYGDTMSTYTLNVSRLSESMYHSDGDVFYNNHSFATYPGSIGTKSVVYRPNVDDSIMIRLNDNLGKELFDMFKANSETIKDAAVFADYLKGFKLEAGSNTNVIYALSASDTAATRMRIYYHNDIGKQQKVQIDFGFTNNTYNFSNINTHYIDALQGLNEQKEVKATGTMVNQELLGLQTRFSFPSIKEILKLGNYVKILNATLEVIPATARYTNTYILPPALNVYYYNISGSLEGPLVSPVSSSATQTGDLQVDGSSNQNTSYHFDITSYINGELATTNYTTQKLVIKAADADNSLYQLVAGLPGNATYKTRLIVSLMVYNDKQ